MSSFARLIKIRNKRHRFQAIFLLGVYVSSFISPLPARALTSGPSAPETEGYTAVSTSDLVDPFTGNFGYTVPLMEVGGYPLNLAYAGAISNDQEASWVGLGWSLSPGAINRQVRSVPDDFNGTDNISRHYNIRTNWTAGLGVDFSPEIFGVGGGGGDDDGGGVSVGVNAGVFYNNYNGPGLEFGANVSAKIGNSVGGSLSANGNSQSGTSLNAGLSLSANVADKANASLGINAGLNSRQGFSNLSLNYSVSEPTKHTYTSVVKTMNKTTNKMENKQTSHSSSATLASGSGALFTAASPVSLAGEKEFTNSNISVRVGLGLDAAGTFIKLGFRGYYTEQRLDKKIYDQPSVGSLYHQDFATNNSYNYTLDFSREKDQPITKHTSTLAVPYGGADYFSVEGKDVGGTFQLTRNDLDVYFDNYCQTNAQGMNVGAEFGIGVTQHGGADVNVNNSKTTTTKWSEGNATVENLQNKGYDNHSLTEPYAFKNIGEINPAENLATLNAIGGIAPISPFVTGQGESLSDYGSAAYRGNRENRKTVMSYLTAQQAQVYGSLQTNSTSIDAAIKSYKFSSTRKLSTCLQSSDFAEIEYTDGSVRKGHHIGEVTITNEGGMRNVYAIPAYNKTTVETSFRLSGPASAGSHMIAYTASDASTGNQQGKDHYFERNVTPGYAYSYLITGIVSPDYVDATGDGITDDDLGSAVRFNYNRHSDNLSDEVYKWRTPISTVANQPSTFSMAYCQEGMHARTNDQLGSYTYGEKEQWYVYSIESKNEVAFFYTSPRKDGLGVSGEDGFVDLGMTLLKLDSIELYSKSQFDCASTVKPVPIKTAHFEYDYSLCKNVPNNLHNVNNGSNTQFINPDTATPEQLAQKGKLTLKKVFFTYGTNRRGVFNAYQFTYNPYNPDYSQMNVDGWGNYQERAVGSDYENYPDSKLYPFTFQDKQLQDEFSQAWCLKKITLPSGGTIEVEYESDSYSYVQTKRTGQMFPIYGFGSSPVASTTAGADNNLYESIGVQNRYIFFKLDPTVTDINKYLQDLNGYLYFNTKVKISTGKHEVIKGYAKIEASGPTNLSDVVYVKVSSVSDQNHSLNPIVLAALQTMRLQLPEIAYPGSDISEGGVLQMVMALVGQVGEIKNMLMGFNNSKISEGYCKEVDLNDNSFIRLSNPNEEKLGGGNRVKRVMLSDVWDDMTTNGTPIQYGQEYSYVKEDGSTCSGVASWEPFNLAEENLHRIPIQWDQKAILGPRNSYYVETPLGESLFPVASVGYERVVVKNVVKHGSGAIESGESGFTVNEFYTAKDFPTRSSFNAVKITPNNIKEGGGILKLIGKKYLTASQGFVIETNDMHGKEKRTSVYSEPTVQHPTGQLISSKEYKYWVEDDNASIKRLVNQVPSISPIDCTPDNMDLGIDFNVWMDSRQQVTETESAGVAANLENFVLVPIPIPLPNVHKSTMQFRSIAVTKFINRHGLLKSVTNTENGSRVTTTNHLYDRNTGRVIVTVTQDEFNDPIYSISYPAYWAYGRMGAAYKSIDTRLKVSTSLDAQVTIDGAPGTEATTLLPGDELIALPPAAAGIYTVITTNPTSPNPNGTTRYLIGESGSPAPSISGVNMILRRSAYRNLQNLNAQELTTKYGMPDCECDPRGSTLRCIEPPTAQVLDFKAYTYSDRWRVPYDVTLPGPLLDFFNPYRWSMLGNWRKESDFVFLKDRLGEDLASAAYPAYNKTDNRWGGHYWSTMFWYKDPFLAPYWRNGLTDPGPTNNTAYNAWVRANRITIYDEKGNEVENRNALGVYSAAVFGYNKQLAVATANNARYQELAFDGFEDYAYQTSITNPSTVFVPPHFSFRDLQNFGTNSSLSSYRAHTGNYSLKVNAWQSDKVTLDLLPATYDESNPYTLAQDGNGAFRYVLNPGGQIPGFSLVPESAYVMSAWVTEPEPCENPHVSNNPITLTFKTSTGTFISSVEFKPKGAVVEGWQRYEEEFTVPPGTGKVEILFDASQQGGDCYFDDFRIHPYNSNMKSFVYNDQTLRLMSTLDENNYATFYEYDEAGKLVRLKKETEKGIMTLQESRNYLRRQ